MIFRRNCIKRSTAFDIDRLYEKLHLLYGLQKVLLDIDLAIKIIRETDKDKEVIPNLMRAFDIDETQAEFVADIKLRNINKEYILSRTNEIEAMEKELKRLMELMSSDKKINKVIIKDLQRIIKNYQKPRLTKLVNPENIIRHEVIVEQIEDYNLKVFFTAHNYMKKVSLVSLRASGDHKIKDDDEILQELEGSNKDEILFFTNQNNVYKMKMHEIDDHKVSSLGVYLPNILEMDEGEEVQYCVLTGSFTGFMLFGFENGKVAKVPLESYRTKTNRKKLVKAFSDDSPLVRMHFVEEDSDMTMIREDEKGEARAIIFNSSSVPEKVTKNTKGVQVFRMKKKSLITAFFKTEMHPFEDLDKYKITEVPKSGDVLDPFEKMTFNQWNGN